MFNREAREFLLEAARHNAVAAQMAASSQPPAGTGPRKVRRRTSYVLVVEDSPDLRDVIQQELADCGYRVRTAINGDEALRVLKEEYMRPQAAGDAPVLPSVILLDIHMPVMNGLNFLVTLRKHHPQFDGVPVVPMSDSASVNEFTRWAIQTEGLDVPTNALPKPFARDLLIERVASFAGLPPDDDEPDDER